MTKFGARHGLFAHAAIVALATIGLAGPAMGQGVTPGPAPLPPAEPARPPGALGTPADAAGAQRVPASADPDASSDRGAASDEIVVTARRREESLQKVPVAISAVGSSFIEAKAVGDLKALDGFIPNVNIQAATTSASSAQIFIRGFGVDTTGWNADANVGIYIDDVYSGRLVGSLVDTNDLERIEVLRGPQGTLYGRNSTAGAVKYITRKPNLNEFQARASATLGSDNRRDFKAGVNIPLVEGKLGLGLSVQTRDQDGYIRLFDVAGQYTGLKANAIHAEDYRAALRFAPNADLTIDIAADYTNNHSGLQAIVPTNCQSLPTQTGLVFNSATNTVVTGQVSAGQFVRCPLYYSDAYSSYIGPFPYDDPFFKAGGVSGTVSYDLGFATFKSVSAYRAFHDIFASSLFGKPPVQIAPPAPATYTQVNLRQDLHQNQFQQEFQLSSAGNDLINYTVGLFYYREDLRSSYYNQTGTPATVPNINNDNQIANSYAAYGEIYVSPLKHLEITLGGRYSLDRKTIDRSLFVTPPYTVPLSTFQGNIRSSKFTPKLGISYDTGPVLLYASYTQGYRPPGYTTANPARPSDQPLQFAIETETSYEAGFKATLFERMLTFNTSIFTAKYENNQATLTINGQTVVVSSDVRIKGLESEFTLRPARGLSFFGNLGLLENRYIVPPPGQPYATQLKHAPKVSFLLGGNYETALGSLPGKFFVGGDVQHTGRAFRNVANTIDNESDAYTLVTARLGYRAREDRWSLTFGGTNLTDKSYYLLGTQNQARQYPRRRQFYVTAEAKF